MIRLAAALLCLVSAVARAQSGELKPLLERGPLVLVEQGKDGKFSQATAIAHVAAPPEKVFAVVVDHARFTEFVPKVITSKVTPTPDKPAEFDVRLVLDVPGPDTDYTVHFVVDEAKREAKGRWVKGDLEGSRWFWKAEAAPGGGTLLTHTITVRNFSAMLTSIEDEQQTMTVGVNVSSALAAIKAIKKRAEAR